MRALKSLWAAWVIGQLRDWTFPLIDRNSGAVSSPFQATSSFGLILMTCHSRDLRRRMEGAAGSRKEEQDEVDSVEPCRWLQHESVILQSDSTTTGESGAWAQTPISRSSPNSWRIPKVGETTLYVILRHDLLFFCSLVLTMRGKRSKNIPFCLINSHLLMEDKRRKAP